ncbi:MAG: hypothetical protein JSV89_15055 [Spirochaetaceae bacterium]|nr:MAG: hypothetical protein JSV89_15055 [Spirochaetaceae bacterium]
MHSSRIELRKVELEDLIHEQGFSAVAFVHSTSLPAWISLHPEIKALGEGTYLITALSCYRQEAEDLSAPDDPHTLIAPFARRNYYAEAVARLKVVVRTLANRHGLNKQVLRIFCNSRLPEKALAVSSSLGSRAKNTLILIPGMGSLFVIAGLFTAVTVIETPGGAEAAESASAESVFPLCGACRACQDACPVGALSQAGRLDESRCLQALCTQSARFSESFRRAWAFRLYGCQSCQDVCPHNRRLGQETETQRGELGPSLSLKFLLSLSTSQIKDYLRGSTLDRSWIPPRTLLRNALLAAGNRRDPVLYDLVARHRSDPDPLVAQAAVWALKCMAAVSGGTQG